MDINKFVDFKEKVIENVSKVIVGKEDVIELIIISFLSGGHVLLEDIPGVGKTMMIKAFSKPLVCLLIEFSSLLIYYLQILQD